MAIFEIINVLYKILLGLFASVALSLIFSPKYPGDHAEVRAPIYQNQTSFPHIRISETKPVTLNFYFISETSKSLPVRSRSFKKKSIE